MDATTIKLELGYSFIDPKYCFGCQHVIAGLDEGDKGFGRLGALIKPNNTTIDLLNFLSLNFNIGKYFQMTTCMFVLYHPWTQRTSSTTPSTIIVVDKRDSVPRETAGRDHNIDYQCPSTCQSIEWSQKLAVTIVYS